MVSIGAHRLMWSIVFVAAMALLLAAAITAGIWFFQERITFQPQGPPFPDDSAALKLQYTADDGQPLFAYVVGEPDSTTSLLIAFHGNADLALRQIDWAH